jgi:hypothetical protein
MLAKLGELHQSLCSRPARNPGATWGSTCLDGPCEQGHNVVLETTMLHRERPEVTLAQFGILLEHPSKRWDSIRNLLGLE